MLKKLLFFLLVGFVLYLSMSFVFAQTAVANQEIMIFSNETSETLKDQEATESALITPVAKKPSLTEPVEEVIEPLAQALKTQPLGPLGMTNFLKYAIRHALSAGVTANTLVLLLLLPLVASLIAAARHFLGIAGFGIFTPAMISVAFLATGITSGLTLFLVILLMATIARLLLKKFKVHYLPRMAILLWFICLGIFLAIIAFPNVSIFPILFMILLVENFIEVQTGRSIKEAVGMTAETLLIALFGYFLMNWRQLQVFVLLNPEISVLSVLLFNVIIGRYAGFRLLEYQRFKAVIRK